MVSKMKKKPYNLGNMKELLLFDRDCYEAACDCSQYNGRHHADDIRNNSITPQDVYYNWKNCDTLMISGYHIMLSVKAVRTFNYIQEYGQKGLEELCQRK
jgi:hypothetical protein